MREEQEKEVIIDTEEMGHFIYKELLNRGFVPIEEEVDEIADVIFDYMIKIGIITEEIDE